MSLVVLKEIAIYVEFCQYGKIPHFFDKIYANDKNRYFPEKNQ